MLRRATPGSSVVGCRRNVVPGSRSTVSSVIAHGRPGLLWLLAQVAGLSPAAFAMVMATGILSIATDELGRGTLSLAFLVVAAAAYAILSALTGWRLLVFPGHALGDARSPEQALGYFSHEREVRQISGAGPGVLHVRGWHERPGTSAICSRLGACGGGAGPAGSGGLAALQLRAGGRPGHRSAERRSLAFGE